MTRLDKPVAAHSSGLDVASVSSEDQRSDLPCELFSASFSGVVGMLAGWFGLAFLVIALAGPDRDGGVAMGAFFNIGPLGALIGCGVGVWLFAKFGLVAQGRVAQDLVTQGAAVAAVPSCEPAGAASPAVTVAPATARISRPFAVVVLAIVGGLAWWAWYELIRSPYLTHGDMTLALQFRLPADMAAPGEAKDVQIVLDDGGPRWPVDLNEAGWRGHQDNCVRSVLASVSMMCQDEPTGRHPCQCPVHPRSSWTLDLSSLIPIPLRAIRPGFLQGTPPTRSS